MCYFALGNLTLLFVVTRRMLAPHALRSNFMPPANTIDIYEKLRQYIKRTGKTQRQIADEAGIPQASYLSHMVNGRVNWVEGEYFRPLTVALGLSVAEIRELKPEIVWGDAGSDTPPPPRLRPIPSELAEMIEEKGHLAEELQTERWQQYLAGQRFSTGRATPERWWNLFLVLKNAGVEPGGN